MQTKNNNKTLMCKQDQFLAWVSTGRPVAHFQPGQCWPVGGGGGVGEVVSLAMRRRIAARREGWGGGWLGKDQDRDQADGGVILQRYSS